MTCECTNILSCKQHRTFLTCSFLTLKIWNGHMLLLMLDNVPGQWLRYFPTFYRTDIFYAHIHTASLNTQIYSLSCHSVRMCFVQTPCWCLTTYNRQPLSRTQRKKKYFFVQATCQWIIDLTGNNFQVEKKRKRQTDADSIRGNSRVHNSMKY